MTSTGALLLAVGPASGVAEGAGTLAAGVSSFIGMSAGSAAAGVTDSEASHSAVLAAALGVAAAVKDSTVFTEVCGGALSPAGCGEGRLLTEARYLGPGLGKTLHLLEDQRMRHCSGSRCCVEVTIACV